MDADRPGLHAERLAQEADDRLHAAEAVLAARVLHGGVGREALRHLVPTLLVETAPVLVLEPPDRLEVLQPAQAGLELFQCGHGLSFPSVHDPRASTSEPRSSSAGRV